MLDANICKPAEYLFGCNRPFFDEHIICDMCNFNLFSFDVIKHIPELSVLDNVLFASLIYSTLKYPKEF